MATQVEQQKYNFLLAKLKENQQIINALITNPQGVDLNEVKDNAQDLQQQLHQQGYHSTNDVQRNVKQIGQQADNVVKQAAQQKNSNTPFDGIFGSGKQMFKMATNMTISMLLMRQISKALSWLGDFLFTNSTTGEKGALKIVGEYIFSVDGAKTIGVAALLFGFGILVFKIYKKIVTKAKESAQKNVQPTREEIMTFINTEFDHISLFNESTKLLTEIKMSVDKQKAYLDMALNVCQDALDVIAMTTIGGGLFYIALTAALAPVMFAAALGSFLWVILFLTRNVLRNKQKEIG
jgi:hypothetical protein